jgi:hypothetical protein
MNHLFKFIAILVLFNAPYSFSQGKIDQSKEELQRQAKSGPSLHEYKKDTQTANAAPNNATRKTTNNYFIEAFLYLSYYSLIGKYNRSGTGHLYHNLTNYPFENEYSGNFVHKDSAAAKINFMRIDVEEQVLIGSHHLYGNHLKAKIRPFQYFYVQTDMFHLLEYTNWNNKFDQLSLYSLDFCYDRIRFETFNLGWNVGLNYIGNDINKMGVSYGLQADAFITQPISIYAAAKWSKINGTPVNIFEVKVRYHQKKHFFSVGYEHLKIGTPTYDFLSVGAGFYFL